MNFAGSGLRQDALDVALPNSSTRHHDHPPRSPLHQFGNHFSALENGGFLTRSQHPIADRQRLDGTLPIRTGDHRASEEADNIRDRRGSDIERRRRTSGGAEIVEDEGSTTPSEGSGYGRSRRRRPFKFRE